VAVTNCIVQTVKRDKGAPTKFGYMAAEGEQARVILTALHQLATPVLRQDTGDMARMHGACPVCGNRTPTLSDLVGSDHLRLKAPQADGTSQRLPYVRLNGSDWRRMLGVAPQDFRLLQIAPDSVRVEVRAPGVDAAAAQAQVQSMLAEIIHPGLRYELHLQDRIEWPPEAPARLRHPIESLLRDTPAAAKS
jgi:phenylacetate-coenzyme A ligase PaaK-like adenylate-forming protein